MTSTATSTGSGWNPEQYERFRDERSRPFYDLAAMVEREPGMRVIDLGCGTGELTAWLHRDLGASETLGMDSSAAMLADAAPHAGDGLRFEQLDVLDLDPAAHGTYDLVFSNATLQWVLGHEELMPRMLSLVRPGGQFAIQMPCSSVLASHRLAHEIAREEPYASDLQGWVRQDPVQTPWWYASLLFDQGVVRQRVHQEVYGHVLPSTRAIVEWVKGTLLTAYQQRLSEDRYAQFLQTYEERLVAELGEQEPCFYPFPRVFLWGRMPA